MVSFHRTTGDLHAHPTSTIANSLACEACYGPSFVIVLVDNPRHPASSHSCSIGRSFLSCCITSWSLIVRLSLPRALALLFQQKGQPNWMVAE